MIKFGRVYLIQGGVFQFFSRLFPSWFQQSSIMNRSENMLRGVRNNRSLFSRKSSTSLKIELRWKHDYVLLLVLIWKDTRPVNRLTYNSYTALCSIWFHEVRRLPQELDDAVFTIIQLKCCNTDASITILDSFSLCTEDLLASPKGLVVPSVLLFYVLKVFYLKRKKKKP